MNQAEIMEFIYSAAGLFFVGVFLILMIVFSLQARRSKESPKLRQIPAFQRVKRAVGLSVEEGTRLHISLGRGSLTDQQGASALAGLNILARVVRAASVSDRPPVATSGEPAIVLLSQDTIRSAYAQANAKERYSPSSSRLTGVTPFSFAAGAAPIIQNDQVSANILVGHFGAEVGLLTDAITRSDGFAVGGSDHLSGQAVMYAALPEALIGEEIYAGGAYIEEQPSHVASLKVQDLFRWAVIIFIVLGALSHLAGVQ